MKSDKIKKLLSELSFTDVKILELYMDKLRDNTHFTDEQQKRINNILQKRELIK